MSAPDSSGMADAQPTFQILKGDFRGDSRTDNSNPDTADSDGSEWLPSDRHAALAKLKRLLSPLPRLRKDAILHEIRARQKRRELAFKKKDVSSSDEKFIRELQRLQAERQLDLFPQLVKLANDCQNARDICGPLEADYNQTEQEVEGRFSELQLTEESVYDYLEALLQSKDVHFPETPSVPLAHQGLSSIRSNSQYPDSQYDTQNDIRYQPLPPENSLALEELQPFSTTRIEQNDGQGHILVEPTITNAGADIDRSLNSTPCSTGYSYYSGSTLNGGIDRPLASVPEPIFHIPTAPTAPYQYKPLSDIENYPELLLEFSTVRERVTHWLLHSLLVSRWEADHFKHRLDAEDPKAPSNWAQLVLAWWEHDRATAPDARKPQNPDALHRQTIPPNTQCRETNSRHQSISSRQKPKSNPPLVIENVSIPDVAEDPGPDRTEALRPDKPPQGTFPDYGEIGPAFIKILFGQKDLIALFQKVPGSVVEHDFAEVFRNLLDEFFAALIQETGEQSIPTVATSTFESTIDRILNLYRDRIFGLDSDLITPVVENNGHDPNHKHAIGRTSSAMEMETPDEKNEHAGNSTSFNFAKDFVLKSAAFETFHRNLADIVKQSMVQTVAPVDCEGLTTPKAKKNGMNHENVARSEITQSVEDKNAVTPQEMHLPAPPFTEDVMPMTRTEPPGVELEGPALPAEIGQQKIEERSPYSPLSNHSKILSTEPENGTDFAVAPGIKANGKTRHNEKSHQSDKTLTLESSASETTQTPSSEGRACEKPTPSIRTRRPTPLQLQEASPIFQEREQTTDQRKRTHDESPAAVRRSKHYEILGSPVRQNGKRAKKRNGPVSPVRSPSEAQLQGVVPIRAQGNRKVWLGEPGQVLQHEAQNEPGPTQLRRYSSRQNQKLDKGKNSSVSRKLEFREHHRRDFRRGKVFKVTEPKSSDGEDGTVVAARIEKSDDNLPQKIRRFLVIEAKPAYCLCLSITSHNGRRTLKDGGHSENHAVIYTDDQPPPSPPSETEIARPAIKIKTQGPYHKLEKDSRLNYERTYHVYYNVKVLFIGDISKDSESDLLAAYQYFHPSDILRSESPPPLTSDTNSTTSGMREPQSPKFGTGHIDRYSFDTGHSSALSQYSMDSGPHILPHLSHGGDGKPSWEDAHPRLFQVSYHSRPPTPQPLASVQDALAKRQHNQSPRPKIPNNTELHNDKRSRD